MSARRPLPWLRCALLVFAAWFVYAPVFRGGWLWDDSTDITGNSLIQDPAGLEKIWLHPGSAAYGPVRTGAQAAVASPTLDYYPLKNSVQWLQWRLWGTDTFGYHLTNVGLHLLSALLIWVLWERLALGLGWLAALLFVVHPVAVESVAWIVELKNTLSLPLLLGAMILYIDWDRRPVRPPPGCSAVPYASVLLFVAALLCKTSVVMFPVVILLHAWWKRGRIGRRDLGASAPFFAAALILGLVGLALHHRGEAAAGLIPDGGWPSRLAGAGLALAFYLWKCAVPAGLMPIYHRWQVDPPSPAQWLPWLGIAAVTAWLWIRRGTYGRPVLFALGFFALNLLPVLGFIRVSFMSFAWVMDHFAYVSLLGVIGLATAGLAALRKAAGPAGARWANLLAAIAVAALAAESRSYARLFSSGETLWTYAVARNPGAWVAESNLAFALADAGRLPEAIAHYRRSLELRPDNPEARNNLGNALRQTGHAPEAIAAYEEALRLKPGYFQALANLGDALADSGRLAEAAPQLRAASLLQPENADLHNSLGIVLAQLGRIEEARGEFAEALRLQPGNRPARANLAQLPPR